MRRQPKKLGGTPAYRQGGEERLPEGQGACPLDSIDGGGRRWVLSTDRR